jgi:TPR repeat protein
MDCMLRAADFYMEGRGVEKDTERGLSILKKAAEEKNPIAQFRMAVRHLSGEKPDLALGYAYLVAAATGNLVEAQHELGLFYLSGKLGGADAPAGVAWLTRAAQNGNAAAQNNLATLYESGAAGLVRNLENAGQLYTLAANQGHGPATLALARLLSQGGDVKPDLAKAWALATLASERGVEDASKLATEIASRLDEKQREEANKELADIKSGKKPEESKPKPAEDKKDAKDTKVKKTK